MDRIKLLVAADVHIGRVTSRVPGADPEVLSARGAWERIIETAIEEDVHALCLTGDLTDETNRFWEAIGPLERGLERLADRGIVTVAVAGNHDHDALPRLADQFDPDRFRLLGRGGRWERWTMESEGEPAMHFDGWSFPRERVRTSPLDDYAPRPDPTVPTLAMVHGDLDVADSPYAPLSSARMRAMPVNAWLLGHVHAPRPARPDDRPLILSPGSPQALDPGEPGVHGVLLLEIEHGRPAAVRTVPVSTVRFDRLDIDVDGLDDRSELASRVRSDVRAFAVRAATEGGDRLRHLVLRPTLRGRTPLADSLRAESDHIRDGFELEVDGVRCSIDRVTLHVLPPLDLDALSRSTTPPGMLSSLILELRVGGDPSSLSDRTRGLLERTRSRLLEQRRHSDYAGLGGPDEADDETVRETVLEQAEALLAQLVGGRTPP